MAGKTPISAELKALIMEKIKVAETTGERVSVWEELQILLKANKLAWTQKCEPDVVGVNQLNRTCMFL